MQFLLGTEDGDEEHIPHALFTELDEICLREGEDAEWKETARYDWRLRHRVLTSVLIEAPAEVESLIFRGF